MLKKLTTILFLLIFNFSFSQINVDDAPYNAVGDGNTDDSAAIQQAINDLRTNGGTLQFTSGKTYLAFGINLYHFSDTQTYIIKSSSVQPAILKIPDGTPIGWGNWGFRIYNTKNLTIQNLIFDGNRITRNPIDEISGSYLLQIEQNCNGLRLFDLELKNSVMDNIYIDAYTTTNEGVDPIMTDFEMRNCILENAFRNNMSIIAGENFKIIGSQFIHANGHLPMAGIDFEPNQNSPKYTNMLVDGCLFKDNENTGIQLSYPVLDCGFSTIKNCTFNNNSLLIGSINNQIYSNIFINQNRGLTNSNGEILDGIIHFHSNFEASNNNVYNNYFYDNDLSSIPNGGHLIYFRSNTGGNNQVHDNFAHGNTISDFVLNDTNLATPPQIINNNAFLIRREMGFWTMDNSSISGNTIQEISDFQHQGTLVNSPTIVTGAIFEALDFSPDNKYIRIPKNINLNIESTFTVSAWVKWNGINTETEQVIVGSDTDWQFQINNEGKIGLFAPNNSWMDFSGGLIQSTNSILQNQWTFITATYNGRYTKLYVNSQLDTSVKTNGHFGTNSPNLYIGSLFQNLKSFNGIIDDVRIYNYSLNESEIQNIYSSVSLSIDNNWINEFKIYPIPTHNFLFIETNEQIKIIQIFNNLGILMLSSKNKKIDLNSIPNGIYFIKIILVDEKTISKKIIKLT